MVNTYSETSYERAKGPKVVSRIPQSHDSLTFDGSAALFRNYDFLCAIDTNTRSINGQLVSAVGVLHFWEGQTAPGISEQWDFEVPFCWEFVGLKVEKAENFGWLAAWEELTHRGLISPSVRVGMVVDSDLGNLLAYNARSKPFFENRTLPGNVTLIYASADTGGESLLNRALKIADSAASQVLDAVESGTVAMNTKRRESPYYEGVRIVAATVEITDRK